VNCKGYASGYQELLAKTLQNIFDNRRGINLPVGETGGPKSTLTNVAHFEE
jgi:hypothetical protein